jgi:methionyl-tRNA formyltransferase
MRLIFAGTPECAKIALERLYESGHEIVLVLTQPYRPAGRGLQLQASSVKSFALEKSLFFKSTVSSWTANTPIKLSKPKR